MPSWTFKDNGTGKEVDFGPENMCDIQEALEIAKKLQDDKEVPGSGRPGECLPTTIDLIDKLIGENFFWGNY